MWTKLESLAGVSEVRVRFIAGRSSQFSQRRALCTWPHIKVLNVIIINLIITNHYRLSNRFNDRTTTDIITGTTITTDSAAVTMATRPPKLCVSGQAVDTFQISPEYSSLLVHLCTMSVVSSLCYLISLTATTTNVDVSICNTGDIPSSDPPKHSLHAKTIQKQPAVTFGSSKYVLKSHQLLSLQGKKSAFSQTTKQVKAATANKTSCCTAKTRSTVCACVCVCVQTKPCIVLAVSIVSDWIGEKWSCWKQRGVCVWDSGCSQRWTDDPSLYSRGGFERLTPACNRSTHRKQLFTFPARAAHSALVTGARWRPLLWAVLIRSIFTLPSYRKVKAELNPRHWHEHGGEGSTLCAHFIWKQRTKNGFSETISITGLHL